MSRRSRYLADAAVASLFLVLTLVLTYPLLLNMGTRVLGIEGDNIWWLGILGWYSKGYVKGYPAILNDTQEFYPHGVNLIYVSGFSLDALLAIPLIFLGGVVFAYNVISVLSLSLSGFTAYLMAYDVTRSRFASILGGIVFGFGAFQMVHALGHFSIFGPFWLPLLALFLNRTLRSPSRTRAFLAGVFFVLASATNGYTGVVAVLLVFGLSAICLLQHVQGAPTLRSRPLSSWVRQASPFVLAFLMPLLLVVPILWYASGNQPLWSLSEYEFWGADPIDYVVPSVIHPVLGNFLLALRPFTWGNFVERSLYLGITPLLLACYVLVRKRDHLSFRYGLVAVFFLVLSLGPILHFAGVDTHLPLPYVILTRLPFFSAARVVSRLGVGVLLSISLLSSMGLSHWLNLPKRGKLTLRRRQLLALVLIMITLFEILPPVPYPLTDPARFSGPVYVWLSHQAGNFGILEYPVTQSDNWAGYHALIAGKETTSGFVNIAPGTLWVYLASLSFLQPDQSGKFCSPVDVPRLVALNIRFILFHKAQYEGAFGKDGLNKALAIANMTDGLHYVGDFDGTIVYEVIATSNPNAGVSQIYCASPAALNQTESNYHHEKV